MLMTLMATVFLSGGVTLVTVFANIENEKESIVVCISSPKKICLLEKSIQPIGFVSQESTLAVQRNRSSSATLRSRSECDKHR